MIRDFALSFAYATLGLAGLATVMFAVVRWARALGDLPWLIAIEPKSSFWVLGALGAGAFAVGLWLIGPWAGACLFIALAPILAGPAIHGLAACDHNRWPKAQRHGRWLFAARRDQLRKDYAGEIGLDDTPEDDANTPSA